MKRFLLILAALLALSLLSYGQTCPSQIASDNFTRANAGTLGANWTIIAGTYGISSNTAVNTSAPGASNPVYWSANTTPNDQCVGVKFTGYSAANHNGPAARVQTGLKSGYYVYCSHLTSTNCDTLLLIRESGDAPTTLQTISSLSIAPGIEIMLQAVGSTLSVWSNNVQIGTNTTDATWTTGHAGLMTFNTFTSAAGYSFFELGDLGTITAAAPTYSPVAGGYGNAQTVTITSATSGVTICYTEDGSTPTATTPGTCLNGTSISNGATASVASTLTLKAIATKVGDNNSTAASGLYTLTVANPTFSPAAGSYGTTQSVTISDATTSAVIVYCQDTINTCTPVTSYTVAVSVSTTGYLRAQATESGFTTSGVASAGYTIGGTTPTSYSVIAPW
jgi:hypothetical protein